MAGKSLKVRRSSFFLRTILCLMLLVVLIACGGGGGGSDSPAVDDSSSTDNSTNDSTTNEDADDDGTPYSPVATGLLPDTGQISSYTETYGEDSDYNINPQSYTKLDSSGSELDDSASDWAMVVDNVTGLIWEVKKPLRGEDGELYTGIHYIGHSYYWDEIQEEFIDQLNSERFGGFSDWRLPTIKELSYLVYGDTNDPAINTDYFPNPTENGSCTWSSTPLSTDLDFVWHLSSQGMVDWTGIESNTARVRAVRGETIESTFVDNGDGTVTDTTTGLMWQQGEGGYMDWWDAMDYCENLQLAGYDDWRLPNRNELQSIVDYSEYDPTIDTTFFPDTPAHVYGDVYVNYWTSTTWAGEVTAGDQIGDAWVVGFRWGQVDIHHHKNYTNVYARAVRGGE